VAANGRSNHQFESLPLLAGLIFSGIFLLFVAILGLYGTVKQHQVKKIIKHQVLKTNKNHKSNFCTIKK